MMDSLGVGNAVDADKFDSIGANTLGSIKKQFPNLKIPHLTALGLDSTSNISKFGVANELSVAKDTSSGHWELAGVPVFKDWGYFPKDYPSFPQSLIKEICDEAKLGGILGNKAASGTEIIEELGEEHLASGFPIFYTSADSNIQIAAHEESFGLEKLYSLCEIAFKYAKPYNIARIIARPFLGNKQGEFVRTKNRHDYSVCPPDTTVLDKLKVAGGNVIAIGKISDIYAGQGISKSVKASGLEELWDKTLAEVKSAPDNSIIFTNFVDFDMLWGHRRDISGYKIGLEYFDTRLPELDNLLGEEDYVFITADHGCDPSYKGTDHTREQVPVIMYGKKVTAENLGVRSSFADIAQTITQIMHLEKMHYGQSFK